MKYKLSILISLIVLVTGCEDSITLEPENSATFSNGMDSERELYSGLTTIAYYVREFSMYSPAAPSARGYLADIKSDFWVNYQALGDNTGDVLSTRRVYRIINQSFVVQQGIDRTDMSEELKDQYRGAVKFYQAWAYLEVMKRFGDCIIVREDSDFGPIAKSPMSEVTAYAIDLAKEAVELLPEYSQLRGDNPLGKAITSKGAANALLAELCLWQAGTKWFARPDKANSIDQQALWQRAEDACTEIINSGEYQLAANAEEVVTEVLNDGGTEGIFLSRWIGDAAEADPRGLYYFNTFAYQTITWPVIQDVLTNSFTITRMGLQLSSDTVMAMYEEKDQRLDSYFYKIKEPEPVMVAGYAYPYKYRAISTRQLYGLDFDIYRSIDQDKVLYRLTQIYMMRAEARAQLGKINDAIADIDVIRARSNASLYSPSEDNGDLLKTIYKECDKEFVYEDERYHRTIRFGERFVREFFYGKFKTNGIQDFIDGAFFLPYNDDLFKENPLMRQNVYWSKRML